jgi:uncharacterized membrane protein
MSEQPTNKPGTEQPTNKTSTGLQENVAGLLCYLGGWITGIIFFLIEKENKFVRFHAIQSIAVSVVIMILSFIPLVNIIAGLLGLILWIVLMMKAYQGKLFKLPVIGDFAAKQVGL